MPKPIATRMLSIEKNDLTVKLLALYDLNKSYIDEAEKFLAASSHNARNETLLPGDIDRLYSHISVLEHVAKLLYEEFLLSKNGQPLK